ncbi:MAG: LytTR family transcriptional regulator [Bacteroidales bacterium]|nr:LytTR family transcriptional regulator [Bacteroidales bacterium]
MESITINNELLKLNELKEIIYLESIGNFTKAYKCNGMESMIEDVLTCLEATLPNKKFFKINELLIINADYLKKVNVTTNKKALMHDGIELKISKQKYNDLFRFLKMRYNIW